MTKPTLQRRKFIQSGLVGSASAGLFAAPSVNAQVTKRFGKHNMLAGRSFKGQKAPSITFENWVANAPADTRGKPIMLKFFATFCPVCQASAPVLNRLHDELGDRITFIALSREGASYLESTYVKRHKVRYPVASDTKRVLFNTYEMQDAYPHYVIIDKGGIVRYEGIMPYTQYGRMRDRIISRARI